jgi:hypothetical protein
MTDNKTFNLIITFIALCAIISGSFLMYKAMFSSELLMGMFVITSFSSLCFGILTIYFNCFKGNETGN